MNFTIVKMFIVVTLCGLMSISTGFSQGQPAPAAEVIAPDIPGVVQGGAKIQLYRAGFVGTEGPIRTQDGGLIFTEHNGNRLLKIDGEGNLSTFAEDTGRTAGLAYDAEGRLIGTAINGRQVLIFTPERSVLVDNYKGQPFIGPNDLIIDRKGGIYFTDPILNLNQTPLPPGTPAVYYIRPDGQVVMATSDVVRPNGVMLSRDETVLYIGDRGYLVAFDVQPDGTLMNRRVFTQLEGEADDGGPLNSDGVIIDSKDRVYSATRIGVQVFSQEGQHLGIIPIAAQNMAFAGVDRKTLWIVGRGAVYTVPMLAEGLQNRAR